MTTTPNSWGRDPVFTVLKSGLADQIERTTNDHDREILASMVLSLSEKVTFSGSNVIALPTNTASKKSLKANKVQDFWKTASVADIDIYLAAGGDINARDDIGRTPLHSSLMGGNVVATQHLIEQGAQVDARDKNGESGLHLAASRGDTSIDAVRVLLDAAPASLLNQQDQTGKTALHHTAYCDGCLVAKELIARGADTEACDKYGWTTLHLASRIGVVETAKALLEMEANIEALTPDGETPVQIASYYGRYRMVQFLASAGATIDDACNLTENAALFAAAEYDHVDKLEAALATGVADIDCQDLKGNTALHLAAMWGSVDAVAALIKAGANCMLVNDQGDSPLHCAVINQAPGTDIISLLLAANADIDARNADKRTPLHRAARVNAMAVKALVDARANVNASDIRGERPLHIATLIGNETCVRVLVDAGADVNAKNDDGLTPRECLLVSKIPALARIKNEIEKMLGGRHL